LSKGSSPWRTPMPWRANHDAETTDWRAVRGRTAYTVRREGRALALPYPYHGRESVVLGPPVKPGDDGSRYFRGSSGDSGKSKNSRALRVVRRATSSLDTSRQRATVSATHGR